MVVSIDIKFHWSRYSNDGNKRNVGLDSFDSKLQSCSGFQGRQAHQIVPRCRGACMCLRRYGGQFMRQILGERVVIVDPSQRSPGNLWVFRTCRRAYEVPVGSMYVNR